MAAGGIVELTVRSHGAMELTPLVGIACNTSGCPTIYTTEGTDLVVQGYIVPDQRGAGEVPAGETLVRIPRELLLAAIQELPDFAR